MPTPQSLLAHVASEIEQEPFPHLIVRDALNPELCDALIDAWPPFHCIGGRRRFVSNRRFSYSARQALLDCELPQIWREMVRIHTSQTFLDQVTALFAAAIRSRYPDFETRFGSPEGLRAGLRGEDDFSKMDVALDAQFCVNTPVLRRATSVRGAHVDRTNKLFAGLFYLRLPGDESTGGDLQIYRLRPGGERRFNDKYIDARWVEVVRTVRYDRNVLVLLLNGWWALHGVTQRSVTPSPRCFFNLLGELKSPLFDLADRQMPFARMRRLARLARGRLEHAMGGYSST